MQYEEFDRKLNNIRIILQGAITQLNRLKYDDQIERMLFMHNFISTRMSDTISQMKEHYYLTTNVNPQHPFQRKLMQIVLLHQQYNEHLSYHLYVEPLNC